MIGTTLQNRYRLDAELGRGGMGVVYRAHDTVLDRDVAVKVLSSAPLDPEARARLLREARAAAQLNHPNIAGVYDAGEANGTPFIVMEFVEGESLHNRRPTALDDILSIARQICAALEHAHAHGIIHRDLKPENVLIAPDGTAKLMDFGLARSAASRLTSDGGFVGTVFYFAPEQALGHEIDGRADLYALGVMLYELATGRLPFTGDDPLAIISQHLHAPVEPPRTYRADIPAEIEAVILRLLAKNPAERYASARDVAIAMVETARINHSGSVATPRHNLPHQLSSFIGREREIAQVKMLLTPLSRDAGTENHGPRSEAERGGQGMRARLVTLTGAGGSGKTRLALQVAAELLPEFPEGVWLVEFAGLSDPGLVPQSVAATLGVREQSGHPPLETLVDYLRPGELLLVLDSCEHLIAACAEMVETLLSICPDLRILATSREALGITGEMALPVPSLSAPDPNALPAPGADPVSVLAGFEAIRLFLDRAAAMQPDFRLTMQNARAVALICHRLDGIPLAVELAAARMRALSVEQIAARLDDRFTLLTGGSRTALPRHQTLRATMDWSYDLLGEAERTLFQRLSVFVGGFLLEAAEKVTTDPSTSSEQAGGQGARNDAGRLLPAKSPRSGQGITREAPSLSAGGHVSSADVLDLLTQLVNKSLVVVEEQAKEARYRMLETIRQYALEKQLESGEFVAVQTRHMEFFLSLAEVAEPELRGAEQVAWLARLEAEHDNLRAALDWTLTRNEREASLRLVGALYRFWYLHGYWSEGKEWIERALRSADSSALESKTLGTPSGRSRARARARALQGLGWLADASGTEGPPYKESLELCRELGDEWGAAFCLRGLGEWTLNQDDYDQAAALLGESLALFRKLKDAWGIGLALFNLGWLAFNKEDPSLSLREKFDYKKLAMGLQDERARAESLWQEGLAEFRRSGDRWGTAVTLGALAYIARLQNDLHKTVEFSDESLRLYREVGDKAGIADSLSRLGNVAYRRDDFRQAAELFEDSLALERELGYKWSAALSTSMLGLIACYQGQYGRATSLVEESLALWRERQDRWGIGWGLYVLGLAEYLQGHLDRAADLLEESLTLFRGLTDAGATAQALDALGLVTLRTGDFSRAAELLEEGLAASRQSGDKRTVTLALNHLGRLALARGDRSAAQAYYREGLMARKDMGARRGITESLEGLAALALAQGRPEQGTTLLGAAQVLRELIGMPVPPVERGDYDQNLAAASSALGETVFAALWAEGRALALEQSIAYALKTPENSR